MRDGGGNCNISIVFRNLIIFALILTPTRGHHKKMFHTTSVALAEKQSHDEKPQGRFFTLPP